MIRNGFIPTSKNRRAKLQHFRAFPTFLKQKCKAVLTGGGHIRRDTFTDGAHHTERFKRSQKTRRQTAPLKKGLGKASVFCAL